MSEKIERAGTKESCRCSYCQKACEHKPGWFMPGEAEKVADFLGMSLQDLFKQKLMVDWYEGLLGPLNPGFVLSPAVVGEEPGVEFPAQPTGRCVFLTEDKRCSIHPVKPFECRQAIHGDPEGESAHDHKLVALQWVDFTQQLTDLLGHEPKAAYPDFLGSLIEFLKK